MKRNGLKKNRRTIILISFVCSVILFVAIFCSYNKMSAIPEDTTPIYNFAAVTPKNNEFIYLSDIDYIANQSRTAWGSILKDTTSAGSKISVKVEGAYYSFDKGMWAHATSTLVYDISAYHYDYFTAYAGLNNTAAASSNGVKFYVYTSVDGTNWDLKTAERPSVIKAGTEAIALKIDIRGAKYLKLVANDNGANGNDHAVYADAKLTNSSYDDNVVPSVAYYDEQIKSKGTSVGLENKEFELLVLQREFVNNVGQFALRRFINEDPENIQTLNWLFNNVDNLREFTLGGAPAGGSYYNALSVLSRLYKNYKSDLDNKELLHNKWDSSLTYSDLYRKMMFSIALTHSQSVALWMQAGPVENQSDAVRRYAIFRYLHKNGKFVVTSSDDRTPWFEYLRVEEMRFIMNNLIDDEEILWLNAYVQSRIDAAPNSAGGLLTPHPYMAYVWPNYANPIYYDEANYDYFNELFAVPSQSDPTKKEGLWDVTFTIPGGVDFPEYTLKVTRGVDRLLSKVWMNFRNKFGTGAVCGGISKTGSNIRATHGIPATVIGQPGHAALLYYTKNTQGQGYWGIDNDVSGWTRSEKGERMLLGWGNASYQRGYSVVYMVLAQEAINNYENLVKSEEYVMLAKAYQGDLNKQEELYREALRVQPINVDAWYGLIQTFNANNAKTEKDYYDLATELSSNLMPFPLPMYHLTNLIKPKFSSAEYIYLFTLLQTKTLTEGSKYQGNAVLQPGVTRTEASYLLGQTDNTIATFSFDGANAGQIVLSSRFDGSGIRWDYSLDGKENWKEVSFTGEEPHKWQLTPAEISSINEDTDIYIHVVGTSYDEANLYKIDITKQILPSTLYANDWENRVIGIDLGYEWRNSEADAWTSYAVKSPNNTGDKTLYVRMGATGTKLASDSITFTFTQDVQSDTRKYVSISHLSIHEYSTQSVDRNRPYYAPNAIDGNIHTLWHTDFSKNVLQSSTKPFITIKLDSPRFISALEFVQTKYKVNDPDYIKNLRVYVSEDGQDWKLAGTFENCPRDNEFRGIGVSFDESVYGEYVKLEMDTYDMFASLAMVNLYEDLVKLGEMPPIANIAYSTTESTNGDVIARLVNPSEPITITNNGGSDSYTFTENGEFIFEFEDEAGNVGTAVAKVDWIDRTAPSADVDYNITTKTNGEVVATLTNLSEDIYILDQHSNITEFVDVADGVVQSITYFDTTGKITKIVHFDNDMRATSIEYFENNVAVYVTDLDAAGSIIKESFFNSDGQAIDPENKEDYRRYNQTSRSNPLVNTFSSNGFYIFRIMDKAGNVSSIFAIVTNIDTKEPMAAVTYNITTTTNQNVVATLTDATEDIVVLNNNGSKSYTFTENGEFTFQFRDEAGNIGYAKAIVTWIKKSEQPEKPNDPNPNNPVTPNKPDSSNNNYNNGNNNNQRPTGNQGNAGNENSTIPDNLEYKTLNTANIKVVVYGLSKELEAVKSVKVNKTSLGSSLQKQVGSASERFGLSFMDEENKRVNLTNPTLTLTISLNTSKEFEGIYVLKDNELQELTYKRINKNTIEVTTDSYNDLVLKYKSNDVEQPSIDQNVQQDNLPDIGNVNINWFIVGGILIAFIALVVLVNKRK